MLGNIITVILLCILIMSVIYMAITVHHMEQCFQNEVLNGTTKEEILNQRCNDYLLKEYKKWDTTRT